MLNINVPATERVEQMDLGEGLLNMGGLVPSIECLASNHSIIRQGAAAVVAAAVQNDDKLKEAAHNSSALQRLLAVYANRDESHETRSKSLHAISALIKGNNTAELHFLFNQVTPPHPRHPYLHQAATQSHFSTTTSSLVSRLKIKMLDFPPLRVGLKW